MVTRPRLIGIVALILSLLAPGLSGAKKPARAFAGKVILSKTPFPASFKSDKAFIRHMKRVHRSKISYPKKGPINLEFMAFFARKYQATEFVATIYDLTDRGRQITSFPIMPNQRVTQILASGFSVERDRFPTEHQYRLVISLGGRVLAETRFAIKETAAERNERRAKERALKNQKVDF